MSCVYIHTTDLACEQTEQTHETFHGLKGLGLGLCGVLRMKGGTRTDGCGGVVGVCCGLWESGRGTSTR
jgi:hypothetical protein